MSCYLIQYKDGAKVMMPISSIQHYLNLRSEEKHVAMVASARSGHSDDKRRLLQFNYSCIPAEDGLLRGCKTPSNSVGMDVDFDDAEMIVLPGGLPGSTNLDACEDLRAGIKELYDAGKPLAAICAAPMVYGHMGLLKGLKATCYPGMESNLEGATYTGALIEKDGQFITGKGPAAAFEFGYAIAEHFLGKEKVQPLRDGMIYSELA